MIDRVPLAAIEEAGQQEYGLYLYAADNPLEKPDFVLQADEFSPQDFTSSVTLENAVELVGCETPSQPFTGRV